MRLKDLREEFDRRKYELENSKRATLHSIYNTNGWTLSADPHPLSQSIDHHPNKTKEDWELFHRNIVHGLKASGHKHNGEYVLLSKSHGHGAAAIVDHKRKTIKYKTILRTGATHATHEGDTKVLVESKIIEIICE